MIVMIMTGGWIRGTTYLVFHCYFPPRIKRVEGLAAAAADAVMFQDCPRSLARE
jgi:hypothetical protein